MDLRTRILNNTALDAMRAARDITGLAAALNADGTMERKARFVTARAILTSCDGGEGILAALEAAQSNTAVSWALKFLATEAGLDVGDPGIYPLLDKLVAGAILTAAQSEALKDMALQPVFVTQTEVAIALYNPDGSEK